MSQNLVIIIKLKEKQILISSVNKLNSSDLAYKMDFDKLSEFIQKNLVKIEEKKEQKGSWMTSENKKVNFSEEEPVIDLENEDD